MNIAIDVRPALSRPTGAGMYIAALAARLPALAPGWRFSLFSSSLKDRYRPADLPPNVKAVDARVPVRLLNWAWHRLEWPAVDALARGDFDLVHSPHPLMTPARRAKRVVTVHDVFFAKHPELTRAEVRRDYAELARDHARRADLVLCPSEHTAAEVRALFEVPAAKIRVAALGVDPAYREIPAASEVDAVISRRRLPRGGILYIGSEEKRKNLVNLVMAYIGVARRLGPSAPPLVLVGPGSSFAQAGSAVGPQIVATGYLEAREIRALMAASRCLVLVSLEEGFGLPVAEAMAAGLPVVCSRGSALGEVAGDAAELVDPADVSGIARGLARVCEDDGRARELRERGLARSRLFDWDRCAERTLSFYKEALGVV
jgi:glycosyltransferase involved in cell wall biosynthesis